jgi:hypothetical protein
MRYGETGDEAEGIHEKMKAGSGEQYSGTLRILCPPLECH